MLKIAVTGDIAAGKSTVCRLFQELGACVVDADLIVATLLQKNKKVRQEVIDLLGSSICDETGELQREKIAKKVFQNPNQLNSLEKILHPYVFKQIEEHFKQAQKSKKSLFVVEIALLFEVNAEKDYDCTICVTADREILDKRIKEKPQQEYEKRRQRQLSSEEKQKRADFVIHNNGSIQELQQQVKALYHVLSR